MGQFLGAGQSRYLLRLFMSCLVASVVVLSHAHVVSAQPNTDAEYAGAMSAAKAAFKGQRFKEAADQFKLAFEIKPKGNLLYNLALSYEKAGDLEEAVRFYTRFVDSVPGSKRAPAVQDKIADLKQSLGGQYRTVKVSSSPPNAVIFIDDRAQGSMGQTPLVFRLMPGKYTVLADLKGHESGERSIDLSDTDQELHFDLLRSDEFGSIRFLVTERGADVMVDRKRIAQSPVTEPIRVRQGQRQIVVLNRFKNWSQTVTVTSGKELELNVEPIQGGSGSIEMVHEEQTTNVWPWVTVGLGGAALIGGGVTGVMAQSLYGKLEEKKNKAEPIAPVDITTGQDLVSMTNLLLIVGGVTVAGGLTWYFLDGSGVDTQGSLSTVLVPTGDGGVLSVGGQF